MAKLGFVVQRPDIGMKLLGAKPSILICVENPGLIDSLKPSAPDSLYIYRDWMSGQLLENPLQAAKAKVEALKPVIEKQGYKYDGFELYNEVEQNDLNVVKRFRDFQLHCLDMLQPYKVKVAVDGDSTQHPHFPQEPNIGPAIWKIKSEVYSHPVATWRCRHEYLPYPRYNSTEKERYAHWFRHQKEIEWLRANNKVVLPHYIGEWGWDKGPPIGPWHNDLKVSKEAWVQGAKDYSSRLGPEVFGYAYFGAGLDSAWINYNLNSSKAPEGIIDEVVNYMLCQQEEDHSWDRVPELVRRWYDILSAESFRLWPYQLIPFKGVKLHGDRLAACMVQIESGGDPNIKSYKPAVTYEGKSYYAWGLMQVIEKVPGHPWFYNRPVAEELRKPAVNVRWGMGILHSNIVACKGNVWEAIRRYSGFAAPTYTMEQFWERYGKKVQQYYKNWFNIEIPSPSTEPPPPPSPPSPPPPPEEKRFKVVKREVGSTIIVGDSEEVGVPIKLYYWGNLYATKTGAKPEYGKGGFELSYFKKANATFEIEYKGVRSKINVVKEFPKTFVKYNGQVEPPAPPIPPVPPIPPTPLEPGHDKIPLKEWPRPIEDNGRGFHAGLNYTPQLIAADIQRLKELDCKWVLWVPKDEIEARKLVGESVQKGLFPIIRPFTIIDKPQRPFSDFVTIMLEEKAAPYIQIFNEPNDAREWKDGKPKLGLFIDKWIKQAAWIIDAGGFPGLQVLDIELLKQVIHEVKRQKLDWIFGRMWFCPHNYGLNHCCDYPYDDINQKGVPVQNPNQEFGEPIWMVNERRQRDKNPGDTIHDDYNCILGFLAFAKVFEEKIGFVPPMIMGEGGWQFGSLQDKRYPKIIDNLHAEYHKAMFEWFKVGILSDKTPLPDYLFAICPWILSGIDADAWYSKILGAREESIKKLKEIPKFTRRFTWDND